MADSLLSDTQQLDHGQKLFSYLNALVQSGEVSQETAQRAWKAWEKVSEVFTTVVPNAAPGARGQILYTWNRAEHHLELEIFPDGPAEFFYRNRATGQLWDYDYSLGEPLPQCIKEKLSFFL